eukprot:TRINITY_DN128_c0_g2_i1.p1 TRINITY_DN128_c0_g2~~TRINITY_DN128_c0_g2_i1.p1  ORF type:complete len:505 (+),score=209.55 TRINITY_DN128_c0_g2_i1:49-1515(+)
MRTLAIAVLLVGAAAQNCSVADPEKLDCGHVGTDQPTCEAAGCCWKPVSDPGVNVPWCFYGAGSNPCVVNWNATNPGFTDGFVALMKTKFEANFNIQGSGMVVAAPDLDTPGGSYYYHWMRDAGLSTWTYMKLANYSYDAVKDVIGAYESWVAKAQKESDPNDIDVRIEPKFTIPDGGPYTGGWCRPQTDGPALRANAMATWGRILVTAGQSDRAKNVVWPLIQNDLAWVVDNWKSQGCDLWEEVRSDDFFWNRMAYIYALNEVADFADLIGMTGGDNYRSVATTIQTAVASHWNGYYLFESTNREKDGAVIHAVTSFGKYVYGPLSREVALTIQQYNLAFCTEFPLNKLDTSAGLPGILYGRYPGDSYAGGNPWQLLAAVHAECFYTAVQDMAALVKTKGGSFALGTDFQEWGQLLHLSPDATSDDFMAAAKGAGDSVMSRIWAHVKNDGGMITEQIDKNSGAQVSAKYLTWSYANILHALHVRSQL